MVAGVFDLFPIVVVGASECDCTPPDAPCTVTMDEVSFASSEPPEAGCKAKLADASKKLDARRREDHDVET